uniref:Metalloendopeptidase n=1 Tax=Glossanodon semifasciatus TaxID=170196 RepID=E2RWN5_GLOSE|nr:hatching enzyme [Glossanodon semifasciatus]
MKLDHSPSLTLLLLLLLGLSQAQINDLLEDGSEEDGSGEEYDMDDPEAEGIDITTGILTANNGSTEMLWEGDMLAPKTRNAMVCYNQNCLWRKGRSGKVEVPYVMGREFSQRDRQMIERAMKSFHGRTCIRFVPYSNQRDYISVQSRSGCFSDLGRIGGGQILSLSRSGCLQHGIIQHEILHALGFQHEQTRSDRDQYVRINWQYIPSNKAFNFHKQRTNNLNTPYDYSSIMHYGRTAFTSQRGRDTITPIPNASARIGQRRDLSRIDIQRVNKFYRC